VQAKMAHVTHNSLHNTFTILIPVKV